MLGIVHHLAAVLHQMGHGVADHRAVFLDRGAQHLGDMQLPALAKNRHHRRLRLEQKRNLRVIADRRVRAPRRSECRQLCVLELERFRLAEKFHILRVRTRPAAFNEIDAERIKPLGNAQLVQDRQLESFTLGAVTQGGVIEVCRFGAHWRGEGM